MKSPEDTAKYALHTLRNDGTKGARQQRLLRRETVLRLVDQASGGARERRVESTAAPGKSEMS